MKIYFAGGFHTPREYDTQMVKKFPVYRRLFMYNDPNKLVEFLKIKQRYANQKI